MTDTPPTEIRRSAELLEGSTKAAIVAAMPEFLQRQRWFGGKARAIHACDLECISHCENPAFAFSQAMVHYTDGVSERYQLPLAVKSHDGSTETLAAHSNAIICHLRTEQGDVTVYDAMIDPDFRAELWHLAHDHSTRLVAPPSRLSTAEQSNTSAIYGDVAILKLYRRLEPGENPDVEVSRFLTQQAHFAHMPAYLGQVSGPNGDTLAFLQEFSPNEGDGWQWMAHEIARALGSGDPQKAQSASIQAAALLGERTAEMHIALATPTSDVAFSAEAFTPSDLASEAVRISGQFTSALDALKQNLANVPAQSLDSAVALLGFRQRLLDKVGSLAASSPFRAGRRIRIHGDYHLGQLLRANNDFLIVDFEGEPAKALAERRRKQSPLRDIAGMVRSFDYAAHVGVSLIPDEVAKPAAGVAAARWLQQATDAFLTKYDDVMRKLPEFLPSADHRRTTLQVYLLEKAMYELLYELNNRPAWLGIPLSGALNLLREAV